MIQNEKKQRKIWPACFILIGIVLASAMIFMVYVSIYYRADDTAKQALQSTETVTVTKIKEGYLFDGEGEENAFIFYPGAKVEYTAYAPLMRQLAEQGVDCFLIKMPCNLAFFGINKADEVMENYEYDHWYLGGHSLGGAMAASYAAKQSGKSCVTESDSNVSAGLDGLILLAAYPTGTLPEAPFKLLTVYGSEDGVLDMSKVESGRQYWPQDSAELCIDGGNHAYFGDYGEQKGDNQSEITRAEQQKQTVDAIMDRLIF